MACTALAQFVCYPNFAYIFDSSWFSPMNELFARPDKALAGTLRQFWFMSCLFGYPIKTLNLISERPPRGGLFALVASTMEPQLCCGALVAYDVVDGARSRQRSPVG